MLDMCTSLCCAQVLWSFVSGHGQMGHSFMGKGVVYRASLIMAHLTHFISTTLHCPAVRNLHSVFNYRGEWRRV